MHKGACGIQRWQTNASREIYIQLTVVGERIYIYILSHFFKPSKISSKIPANRFIYILYNIYERKDESSALLSSSMHDITFLLYGSARHF